MVEKLVYNGHVKKEQTLYEIISRIPAGKVSTYGRLARLAGIKSPRQIGKLLHQNPDPKNIPCHRVVNSQGRPAENYAFGGDREQVRKLRLEGIEVVNQRVDLKKYGW